MLLASLALSLGSPPQAPPAATPPATETHDVKPFAQAGGWFISQSFNERTCMGSMSFEDDSELAIHWRPRQQSMSVFYEDAALKSLEQDKTYELDLYFDQNGKLDDSWGKVTATGLRTSRGVPEFFFRLKGAEALTDFATSTRVAFFYGDKLIASLNLTRSAEMVREIRRCSDQILKLHPADPFAD